MSTPRSPGHAPATPVNGRDEHSTPAAAAGRLRYSRGSGEQGPRVQHFCAVLRRVLDSTLEQGCTDETFARAFRPLLRRAAVDYGNKRDADADAESAATLSELRAQFVQLVSVSTQHEFELALAELGVREKLNLLDELCERQPPFVDGSRHLPPARVAPEAALRAVRMKHKSEARERLRELVAEERYKLDALQSEVESARDRVQQALQEMRHVTDDMERMVRETTDAVRL